MAYMHGYPEECDNTAITRQVAFMALVLVVIGGLMFDFSKDPVDELVSVMVPLLIILSIMMYVFYRVNPGAWKRGFRKTAYLQDISQDRTIAEQLQVLDDNFYIIYDFTFELFHVDFLVVSPSGIFVVAGIRTPGALEVKEGILFAGSRTQETLTGNLWRICHLVNIVVKKGYHKDTMPKPILVAQGQPEVTICDDIEILSPDRLAGRIAGHDEKPLDIETVQGFSHYVKEHYAHKG